MAKMVIDFPTNLEKIKPKSGKFRRFSTGNEIIKISEPIPIPNYLRASIGSCHDFCKYGGAKHESINTKLDRVGRVAKTETRTETNSRGNKSFGKKKLVPLSSSRQQPNDQLKPIPPIRSSDHSTRFLKTTKNVQTSQDNAVKRTRSLPITSSSVRTKTGTSSSEHNKVPEKIVPVVRTRKNAAKDKDSSSRKVKNFKRGKTLEVENGEDGSKGVNLRRVVSDGEMEDSKNHVSMREGLRRMEIERKTTNPDSTNDVIAKSTVQITTSKVKAIVDAFETLIITQDCDQSSGTHIGSI